MARHPNFLIVGAAKAGTTALHHLLGQHPEVFMCPRKETFFFSRLEAAHFPGPGGAYARRAVTDPAAYRALFREVAAERAVGEASVAYLYYHAATIPRVLDTLGRETKIVVALRQPADRAFSNYMHHVRDGLEPLPFRAALAAEAARRAQGWWWGFRYADVSRYHAQVRAYVEAFGADRVHVLLYEDFREAPVRTMQALYRFLEVDDAFVPEVSLHYQATGVPRSRGLHRLLTGRYPGRRLLKAVLPGGWAHRLRVRLAHRNLAPRSIPPAERQALTRALRDDLHRLQDLLRRDLAGWEIPA